MQVPKCFLLLIVIAIWQVLPTHANMEKTEYMLSSVYEPYEHQFNSFKETVNSAINSVHHIFENHLLQRVNDQNINATETYDLFNSSITYQSASNHRMLKDREGKCLNRGFTVSTVSFIYKCNGETITKSHFEENQEKEDCSIDKTQRDFCYCPFDFYGAYCEKFNSIQCDIKSVSHPAKDCRSPNPQTYVTSYGQNDKPCYHLPRNTPFDMTFRVDCQPSNPQWNYEGIKTTEDVGYEPVLRENAFKYELDKENLKASDLSFFSLQFKFVNWNRVFKPYVIEKLLTPDQITGSKDITFTFNLDSKFDEYRLSGRYHYELVANEPYLTSNRLSGVLEDSNFTEPRNKKKNRNFQYMVYIGLTLVVVVVTFFLLKHKNIISWRRPTRKESYEPLIDVLDNSHASTN